MTKSNELVLANLLKKDLWKERTLAVPAHFLYVHRVRPFCERGLLHLFTTGWRDRGQRSISPDELTEAYRVINKMHHVASCQRSGIPTSPLNYKGYYMMGLFQILSLKET